MIENLSLLEVGMTLKELGYDFTAITPESHHRVLARNNNAVDMRGVFGWNQPFSEKLIPNTMFKELEQAGVLCSVGEHYVCQVRFATLYDSIYLHSGFPTLRQDAVFFGPDTYRYARLLREHIDEAKRIVDIGCGSGAGAMCLHDRVEQMYLTDINPQALDYSRINAKMGGFSERVKTINSDVLKNVQEQFDLVISNPPYMIDDAERTYRHGGKLFGAELSLRIVREGLEHLAPKGKLVLYTASAIVDGIDVFWRAVQPLLKNNEYDVFYEEIDPDVFGEELDRQAYKQVDRIAVVGLVVQRK